MVSGVCLLDRRDGEDGRARRDARHASGALDEAEIARYVASGEWEGRAGGYAIQGLGGRLVERIEGDYLNVVGLPGALLVRLLAERAPALARALTAVESGCKSGGSYTQPLPWACSAR